MKKPTLVFVHGWGLGPFVWEEMMPDFSGYDCRIINMGFFGEEDMQLPSEPFIGVGHSLGGLWLLKHYQEQMIGFVSISSFHCFYEYVSKHLLSAMKRNIVNDADKQIKDFWNHAGADYSDVIKRLNADKLIEGLLWLSTWKCDIQKSLHVKVLASRDDLIVSHKMTEKVWNEYDIDWIDSGGHTLPMTQSQWCTAHIKEFINDINQ